MIMFADFICFKSMLVLFNHTFKNICVSNIKYGHNLSNCDTWHRSGYRDQRIYDINTVFYFLF